MIRLTAGAALDAATLLTGWVEQILRGAADVPPRLALLLQRTRRAFGDVAGDLLEQEDGILRRHGALEDDRGFVPRTVDGKEEQGTFVIDDPDQLAACNRARAELFAGEVEIDAHPLPLDEILAAGLTLTGRQAIQLAELFENYTHQEI
jgi:hypothetical protein